MIDIGVASPSAQGQAMISTDTALNTACVVRGLGSNDHHTSAVPTAIVITTGTK